MVRCASAMTGCARPMTGRSVQAMGSVTVGSANVMKAGMVKLVSIQLLAILHGRQAMKCVRIPKISSVLVQAHVSVAGVNVQTQKEMDWSMVNFVNVMTENA